MRPPAVLALVRMGGIAVPKLAQALLHAPIAYKRIAIVLCLSRIGGPEAKSAIVLNLRLSDNGDRRGWVLIERLVQL
jgi:hypothetical protein